MVPERVISDHDSCNTRLGFLAICFLEISGSVEKSARLIAELPINRTPYLLSSTQFLLSLPE